MPVRSRKPNGKPEGMDSLKLQLAKLIGSDLDRRELTQTEAAHIMRDAPSQISLVVTGKLKGFSTDRLLRMLNGLGRDIEIRVKKPHDRKRGKTALIH